MNRLYWDVFFPALLTLFLPLYDFIKKTNTKRNLTFKTDLIQLMQEISDQLSILIKYEAMLHKVDLEEDL